MTSAGRVIVAGAGIWGCTVARRLAEAGHKVLVLEKRAVVGGNCRCETDSATGIETHLYGSHIFHTRNEEVWGFVNRFAKFNDYRHCVLARYKDRTYHLPIGCTLLKEFFGRDLKPSELTPADRAAVFDAFVRGYTSKQWGVPPEKVPASVIARLKVRDSSSTDYFDDPHQGIPVDGYNALFEWMLDHPNITVECNCEFTISNIRTFITPDRLMRCLIISTGRCRGEPWTLNLKL
ncbi:MAG: FAD-dependent oxidoreductase [bacterium]|nr:FAD-dependent oxidoreductase [Candidatus Colisoma equi]